MQMESFKALSGESLLNISIVQTPFPSNPSFRGAVSYL